MKKPEILVIDENTKVLFAFDALLEREGCVAISAENLAEGLNKLSGKRPKAIFLDISESLQINYKILDKIRDIDKTTPLILMTSHLNKEIEEKYKDLNVNGFLEKPLSIEKIREVLRQLNISSGK